MWGDEILLDIEFFDTNDGWEASNEIMSSYSDYNDSNSYDDYDE